MKRSPRTFFIIAGLCLAYSIPGRMNHWQGYEIAASLSIMFIIFGLVYWIASQSKK